MTKYVVLPGITLKFVSNGRLISTILSTVKPIYNGHHQDLKVVAVIERCLLFFRA